MEASEDLIRPIKVGQSSSLRVGQQCLAIGNPFGFDHTLTVGVISGLNRDIFSQTGVTIGGGVQTDAAINPGNRSVRDHSNLISPLKRSILLTSASRSILLDAFLPSWDFRGVRTSEGNIFFASARNTYSSYFFL